jgi:hypothetical protein
MICVSTGWMYAQGIYDISKQEELLSLAGADGCEIFIRWEQKRIDSVKRNAFSKFSLRFLHLPSFDKDKGIQEYCRLVLYLYNTFNPKMMTLHPSNIPKVLYQRLSSLNLPIAIENLDKSNISGKEISELKNLCLTYNFKFVFDVQHAYEYDPTMSYSEELIEALSDKMVYCHISGQKGKQNHMLVCESENKGVIIRVAQKVFEKNKLPLIIEGAYLGADDLKKEIAFLKNYLLI